jgi:predicted small secreted protein
LIEERSNPTTKGIVMRRNLALVFAGLVVLLGASTFLSACHTVAGAGQDISHAGSEITEEAKEHTR